MKKVLAVIAIAAGGIGIYVLTDDGEEPTTTTLPVAPPTPTTSTVEPTPRPTITTGRSTFSAALPDGNTFTVDISPAVDETIVSINAGPIVMDIDGVPVVVGSTQVSLDPYEGTSFSDGVYRTSADGRFVQIEFRAHVLDSLGPDAESVIRNSITAISRNGYPVLHLEEPFRWGDDDQFPAQMGVRFETFEVRRGCGELAVACNETRAVQVIPLDRLVSPAPEWPADAWVNVFSQAPRPESDLAFLPPGPLTPRLWPDVLWAPGYGMIVWGGAERGERPYLTDGAIFDPDTGEWSLLPEAPVRLGQTNRAVWVGDRMIVVSPDGTVAYDPATDTWEEIAPGLEPSGWKHQIAATDDHIWVWTHDLYELNLDSGVWTSLPDPLLPVGAEFWQRAVRVLDGDLVAVGTSGFCDDTSIAIWEDGEWWVLREGAAFCPRQSQSSVDVFLFWAESGAATYFRWIDGGPLTFVSADPHGMGGTEGAAGGLDLGGGRILVPQYGEGAVFETGGWTRIDLPGWGTEWEMVWTGEEVLMWGVPVCCLDDGATVDAWRWTPPSP
jgi:hypothetical protein